MKIKKTILISFIILNTLDLILTVILVNYFGVNQEANPFVKVLFENNLTWLFVIGKLFIINYIAYWMYKQSIDYEIFKKEFLAKIYTRGFYWITIIYLFAIITNMLTLLYLGLRC